MSQILEACVAANHPNDGVNEMTIGGGVIHVCDECFRRYNAELSAARKARRAAPRPRRAIATTGAAGEWNAFVALTMAVSRGTLPR